jgi:Maltokinase N-terminal cap domain
MYRAELHPGKLELLAAWLPTRSWYRGPAVPDLKRLAACRFDDPAGEVGIETIVVQAGDGVLLHTPLTYRNAPLDRHEQWLVGIADHSVLGRRWVYDACSDPIYVRALATTILTGAVEAAEFIEIDGRIEPRQPNMSIKGGGYQGATVPTINTLVAVEDGDPTVILTEFLELSVARVLDLTTDRSHATDPGGYPTLAGTWSGQPRPIRLAHVRRI